MNVKTPFDESKYAELHGWIVSWYCRGDVQVTKLRESATKVGIDPSYIRDLLVRSTFSRATKGLKADGLIEEVVQRGQLLVFQLSDSRKEIVDRDGIKRYEVTHACRCQVDLDLNTGSITCDDPVVQSKARDLYAYYRDVRNASDITRMIQKLFKENAEIYPINPEKGVAYFVPFKHKEWVDKIDSFLREVGGYIARFPVPKGVPEGDSSVRDALHNGMQHLLKELEEAASHWDDHTRKGTVERGVREYQQAKHKIESYAEFMGTLQAGLLENLDKTRRTILEKLEVVHSR